MLRRPRSYRAGHLTKSNRITCHFRIDQKQAHFNAPSRDGHQKLTNLESGANELNTY